MGERLFELRRRTFDTPQFRGIEFIEVEAKTIINHVPGNYLPFNWTINPYRGCSHACSYCASGETPILMADGRTEALTDLAIGDSIYGTVREGNYRRYVTTEVLAHWSTVKPAYRVVLEGGTELIASGDHRFLSDRGWNHVSDDGAVRDSLVLKPTDRLMGIDDLSQAPSEGALVTSPDRLQVAMIEPLRAELPLYDITTGTGDFIANGVVSHNCFARSTHTYMDMNAGRDFETKIVVKVNAGERLRKELRAKKWKGEHIAMGTATDPYQRAEGRYKLMPQIIGALSEVGNPFSILTKGTLILRDLDLLTKAADVTDVSCAFSIGTLDEKVWHSSEPGTPHPRKRIDAVKKINDAGIPCGVMVAPILPGISDGIEQLKSVVTAAIDAGASHVTPIMLHLRPKVKEVYMEWLEDEYPQLVDRYDAMYARSAYAAKGSQDGLRNSVYELIDDAGGLKPAVPDRPSGRSRLQKPKVQNEQLSLI
jgi:DNA repair photolyase